MKLKLGKTEARFSFPALAVAALLAYSGRGKTLAVAVLSALLHETGHLLAIRLCGGRTAAFAFGLSGGDIRAAEALSFSYRQDIVTAAAGPLASATAAAASLLLQKKYGFLREFTLTNIVFAAVNLLPAKPLDGERILRGFLLLREDVHAENRLRRAGAFTIAGLELLCAATGAYGGVNPSLLLFTGLVIFHALQ